MAAIAELQKELKDIAGKMAQCRDAYQARKKDIDAGKEGVELWPEAERRRWDELNQQYDAKKAELEQLEQESQMAARCAEADEWLERRAGAEQNNRPTGDDTPPGAPEGRTYGDLDMNPDQARQYELQQRDLVLGFEAWAGFGVPSTRTESDAHREACQRIKFNPASLEIQLELADTSTYQGMQRKLRSVHPDRRADVIDEMLSSRALASGIGASGGFISVPATVMRAVEVAMISWGQFLQFVQTLTTQTGETIGWPVADDTSNSASYTDENQSVSSEVDPGYESVQWGAHDLQSGFIKVPFRLFRDNFINLESHLGMLIGERFGRKLNSECTTGTNKIRGVITRSPTGQLTAGATAIVYADIVGLEHSLDPAHRAGAMHMFHDAVLEVIRLLTDDESRPLWQSNIAAGVPDTINGRRYVINQDMASALATGNKTMAFGQLMAYKLRRVGRSLRLRRLVERFAEADQTAFIGYMSADGNLLRPQANAACPIQLLEQTS